MQPNTLHTALAQYPLHPHKSFTAWRDHISSWVREAVAHGAKLLVFPEYGSTDLAAITGGHTGQTANELINDLQKYLS